MLWAADSFGELVTAKSGKILGVPMIADVAQGAIGPVSLHPRKGAAWLACRGLVVAPRAAGYDLAGVVDRESSATQTSRRLLRIASIAPVVGAVALILGSSASVATARCVLPRPPHAATNAAPAHALLAALGVFRRPQRPTDSLPLSVAGGYNAEVFVRYVRRVAVVDGTGYYLVPAVFTTCEPGPPYQAARFIAVSPNGGSGGTEVPIQRYASGPVSFSSGNGGPRSTVAVVVPDRVASVTLHLAADPPTAPKPLALHARVASNCVVFANVPRSAAANSTFVLYAANGRVIPQ